MNKLLTMAFICLLPVFISAQASAWRCQVNAFNPTDTRTFSPCDYVSGGTLQLQRSRFSAAEYFTFYNYTNTICLSENWQYEVRVRAGSAVGGIAAYDFGMGLETPIGAVSTALMSNDASGRPWTHVTIGGIKVVQNSALLVRDLTNWATLRLSVRNRVVKLFYNNTEIYAAPAALPVAICSVTGFNFYFKGTGMVDYVKFTDFDNNRDAYFEDFTDCNTMATPMACINPTMNLTTVPVCEGDTLKVNAAINPQPTSVEWTGPNGFTIATNNLTFPNAQTVLTGDYTLKANYNGCIAPVTKTITAVVNPKPKVNLGNDTTLCANGSLVLNPKSGAGSYRWSLGTSNPTQAVYQSGTYSVTVTNGSGCKAADTIVVSLAAQRLSATVDAKSPTCFNSCNGELLVTPQGGFGAPYKYKWIGTSDTTPSVKDLCAGTFGLQVTDARGCTFSTEATLVQPQKMVITAKPDSNYNGFAMRCGTDTVASASVSAMGGNGGFNYVWKTSPVQMGQKATNLRAGSYWVLVTDAGNCTDSIRVDMHAPDPLSMAGYEIKNVKCFGDKNGEIRLGKAKGGTKPLELTVGTKTYSPDSALVIKGLSGGSYPYYLVDNNQCSLRIPMSVLEPPKMLAQTSADTLIRFGDDVKLFATLQAPAVVGSVKWLPNRDSIGLICANCKETKASPRKTTIFNVVLADNFGCELKKQIIVQVDKNRRVFVPTAFSPNEDGQNDRFTVLVGSGTRKVHYLRVFNRWGLPVFERRDFLPIDDSLGWDGKIDGGGLSVEMYVWVAEIEFEDGEREIFKGDVTLFR